MLIALDYDGTFTSDTGRWKEFISLMKEAGHSFVCVTSRAGTDENKQLLGEHIGKLMPIIFCNHQPKIKKCTQLGYRIDVWIDDRPHTIPVSARVNKRMQSKEAGLLNTPVYIHPR